MESQADQETSACLRPTSPSLSVPLPHLTSPYKGEGEGASPTFRITERHRGTGRQGHQGMAMIEQSHEKQNE